MAIRANSILIFVLVTLSIRYLFLGRGISSVIYSVGSFCCSSSSFVVPLRLKFPRKVFIRQFRLFTGVSGLLIAIRRSGRHDLLLLSEEVIKTSTRRWRGLGAVVELPPFCRTSHLQQMKL
jgi:hypothetical protein